MANFETITYEKHGLIAHITLNRPKVLNAYNVQMRDDLFETLTAVDLDNEVRCLIISGAGDRAFCAGADLKEFGTAPSQVIAREVRWQRDVWGLLMGLRVPTIAALNGYVLGSGLEIALCCDIRIATDKVQVGLPEASLGFIPAAGGTQTLPRTIGISRSLCMLLSSRYLCSLEALESGLITEITQYDELIPRCYEIASNLLQSPNLTLEYLKQAVYRGIDFPICKGIAMEAQLATRLFKNKASN